MKSVQSFSHNTVQNRQHTSYAENRQQKVVKTSQIQLSTRQQSCDVKTQALGGIDQSTLIAGAGVAAVGVSALVFADPEKRREAQTQAAGGDETEAVKNYFNTKGFERWRKIYGETDDVNKVQLDIRQGHAQTVDKVLGWLDADGSLEGQTFADAGCGTGSLTVPLAERGAKVFASDISSAMVTEAQSRFQEATKSSTKTIPEPSFEAAGLEDLSGSYDTVACLDVFIHYPQDRADAMVQHLASVAKDRVIVSFAPYTLYYAVLKRIGELFPGPSKATRAYLHAEADVEAALKKAGFEVTRRDLTATQFYFSRLLEAKRT